MAVESAADRAAFFDADEFGVTATLVGGATVDVIFDAEHAPVDLGEGVSVSSDDPRALLPDSVLAASGLDIDDTLTIAATTYTITDIQPDGRGVTVLVLREG